MKEADVAAKPADPTQPLGLRLKVDYLVCEKICIPYTARLTLDLAGSVPAPRSVFADSIPSWYSKSAL